jgi:hypothetical protein
VAHDLEQAARRVAHAGRWAADLSGAGTARPRVHFKAIVSGEVVLDSRTSPLSDLIAQYYSDAAAIDMESAGVAEAAHRHGFHRTITVRGISDAADGRKHHSDAAGWQPRAAANAAAFAIGLARVIAPTAAADPLRPSTRAHPRSLLPSRVGSALRRAGRWRYLLPTLLVAAVSLLIYVGTSTLFEDQTDTATQPSAPDPAASERTTPAPASTPPTAQTSAAADPGAGWVLVRQGNDVELRDEWGIDLESGQARHAATFTGDPDLKLAQRGNRISAGGDGQIKELDEPGPQTIQRCRTASVEDWDGSQDVLHNLPPGHHLCVSLDGGHIALLTVVRPPNAADPVLVFDYLLWTRTGR